MQNYIINNKNLRYEILNIPIGCDELTVNEAYQKKSYQFLNNQISLKEWQKCRDAYSDICQEFELRKEMIEKEQEKTNVIEEETYKKMFDILKKEAIKGPLWKTMEDLIKADINISESKEDFFEYVAKTVLGKMDSQYHDIYYEFYEMFIQLWNQLYDKICLCEYEAFKKGDIRKSYCFTFGVDELTNECFYPGEYKKLFDYSKWLSNLIPDTPDNYFFDAHLTIFSRYFLLEYELEYGINCPIYSFSVTNRLQKIQRQYIENNNIETFMGKTIIQKMIAYNKEMKDYILNELSPYNKHFNSTKHKVQKKKNIQDA